MYKKRGIILVILVLLTLVSSSLLITKLLPSVLAEDDVPGEDPVNPEEEPTTPPEEEPGEDVPLEPEPTPEPEEPQTDEEVPEDQPQEETEDGDVYVFDEETDPEAEETTETDPGAEFDDTEKESIVDETVYGCWNSQVVPTGGTIMNVMFDVSYQETEVDIDYKDVLFDYEIVQENLIPYLCVGEVSMVSYLGYPKCAGYPVCKMQTYTTYEDGNCASKNSCPDGNQCWAPKDIAELMKNWKDDIPECKNSKIDSDDFELTSCSPFTIYNDFERYKSAKVNYIDSPKEIGSFELSREDFTLINLATGPIPFGEPVIKSLEVISYNDKVEVYFLDPLSANPTTIMNDNFAPFQKRNVSIMAKLSDLYKFKTKAKNVTQNKTITYSCTEDECLYPLPGMPPYKITNLYPNLYEMYFVKGNKVEDEILITQPNQDFTEYGNIKVKKVSQQVIYVNELYEDGSLDQGFYGCQAASFLMLFLNTNLDYCAVEANQFCSNSVTHKKNKEKYATINAWSGEDIEQVGYDVINDVPEENITLFYEHFELKLKDQHFDAKDRIHKTEILPARNFISNAEFKTTAKELPHWEIIQGGIYLDNEVIFVQNKSFITLNANDILRSERIAVDKNTDMVFFQSKNAPLKIIFVNNDGQQIIAPAGNGFTFNTGISAYIILEFSGPGTVEEPMLQIFDDLGPTTDYNYNPKEEISRSSVACCPTDYCWNGYSCVEPMGDSTHLSEYVEEGRFYRCLNGTWKHLPVKWDWNADKWGFCKNESQCLVLRSTDGANSENKAEDFYHGNYPTCIENNEYIFDNYCQNGQWTSRTKFLATKLLEVAETDEYVLYCSNYKESLVEFDNKENYLGGEIFQENEEDPNLDQVVSGESTDEVVSVCFTEIEDPEGKRLVRQKDNNCINNVCVLKYKDGKNFKVAFATTLNKEIDDIDSFLLSLDVPQEELANVCPNSGAGFLECDLDSLGIEGDLWYTEDIKGVVYAKDGIQVQPSVVDKILNWFKDLFGVESEISDESNFVDQAQNFRDLYILNKDGKNVRAMKEVFPNVKQTLIAEYENFETPVCEYVNNINLPLGAETEPLEEASGMNNINCKNPEGNTQRVEILKGIDFFWPQLTGKLRVNE